MLQFIFCNAQFISFTIIQLTKKLIDLPASKKNPETEEELHALTTHKNTLLQSTIIIVTPQFSHSRFIKSSSQETKP